MQRLTIRAALPILSAALCAAVLYAAPLHASSLERQRALFVQVFASAERGDWSAVESLAAGDRELLKTYLLWPDLVGAYLKARLRQTDVETIERYLHHYGSLKPARELRYRYALDLVRRGDDARRQVAVFAAQERLVEPPCEVENLTPIGCPSRSRQVVICGRLFAVARHPTQAVE